MSPFPEDDPRLAAFLQQHRPEIPPPAPDLEEKLMAAIATTPQQQLEVVAPMAHRSPTTRRHQWFMPSAIAAGFLVTLIGYRAFNSVAPSNEADLAQLEAFIETTWQDPVAEQPVVYAEELLTQPEPAVN